MRGLDADRLVLWIEQGLSTCSERWHASVAGFLRLRRPRDRVPLPCYRAAVATVPELLLLNGAVEAPGGTSARRPQAVAVREGRIAAIGSDVEVRAMAGRGSAVVDLGGRSLLPGFIDAHVHPLEGGLSRRLCDLHDLSGADAYHDAIATYAAAHPERPWVTGGGWSLADFPGGLPRREALDRLVPDRPAILTNRDGHGAWVNSAALRKAGISSATPDPVDGRIERDPDGEPTGMLQEGAIDLMERHVPPVDPAERLAGLLEGQRYLHGLGLTGWQDAIVRPEDQATYVAAVAQGALTARARLALLWDNKRGLEQVPELVERRDAAASAGLDARSVKLFVDGIIENRTALLVEPYLEPGGRPGSDGGIPMVEPKLLHEAVTALDAAGFQCHFHAIGDGAIRLALDALQAAREANGPSPHRPHLAHIELIHPDDLPRFADLGAVANMQPFWAMQEAQMRELRIPVLGMDRARWQFAFRSLLNAGARLGAGSDWPVTTPNPLLEMEVALTRTDVENRDGEALFPEERLSLDEALAAFTIGSAFVNHVESETGSIQVGKRADVVVLDRDIRAPDAGPLGIAQVVATLIDGRLVSGAL
jgi:predicted amidohydrolase YtcJ